MRRYQDLGDDQLLLLIGNGEKEALEELYTRYSPAVYSMARYLLKHLQQAEEVTQDIFVNVWLKAKSYDPSRGALRTWLMSVAHHRIVDELRARRRLARSSDQVPHELLALLPTEDPSPEAEAVRNVGREKVKEALSTLPVEQREVIVLAYFGGYSQSEIAEKLGQPLGTVKTRTRLGMQKLKEVLKHFHVE